MKSGVEQQEIRAYLLGQLSSERQSQFEELLLTDDDVFQELEIVEDELVDGYLREELTPADRAGFESHFMAAPEHREKLTFARAFKKSLSNRVELSGQAPAPAQPTEARGEASGSRESNGKKSWFEFFGIRNPALGYATAVALLLIVVGLSWVVWRRATTPRDPGRVLSVALTAGLTRDVSEGPRKVSVSADIDTLRLQLIIPNNRYQSYEATLLDAEGRGLATESKLPAETVNGQPAVTFDIPANLVAPGDYRVKVTGMSAKSGAENLAVYSFRVTK
ncbi:MAG TPA: hypothetical protein VFZ40_12870 [Pyrinomonadaceae bacterium]